jgi:3-oxoacyl-[acyl-carrier-protein] synthase-3
MKNHINYNNGGKLMPVYINDIAAFLPNDPVDNDHMEEVLGKIHNIPSRVKSRILKNNGILKRIMQLIPKQENSIITMPS